MILWNTLISKKKIKDYKKHYISQKMDLRCTQLPFLLFGPLPEAVSSTLQLTNPVLMMGAKPGSSVKHLSLPRT